MALPRLHPMTVFYRVMAVLNLAALGMLADGEDIGGASPLVVLPALWLGLDLGLRGAALAVGATLAFLTVPGLLAHGTDAATMERLLAIPIVAAAGGVAISAGLATARSALARAEAREAELNEAVAVIERTRRAAEAIFDAVPIGLALLERDGHQVRANHGVDELSGYAFPDGAERVAGAGWVFDEDGTTPLATEDSPTWRACRGEEFDDLRIWVGELPAERRAIAVSARRVEDPDGGATGAAVSYADVTDYMRALEVKDDFISLVSHELRTPLTSIVGYVEVLLDRDDLAPVLHKQVDVVRRNAERLERLVGGLLDVQQPAGPARLVDQTADLADIVRECVAEAEPDAVRAGVALELEAPAELPFSGDRQRLGQVVRQLVSNAVKHTDRGGRASVHVEIGGEGVVVQVRDTGFGIAPRDRPMLFERFFRTEEATRRAIQGAGLGLAVARSIVESHGGVIEVESEVGIGSEFRVVLPLRLARIAS